VIARVVELWRYPVKSMGGERILRAPVGDKMEGDRDFGVFDVETGKLLSAKTIPKLLDARVRRDGATTVIELPGGAIANAGSLAANRALSEFLGRRVEVRGPGDEVATIDMDLDDGSGDGPTGLTSFTAPPGYLFDSRSTLHVISVATLAELERACGSGAGDGRRWRANLIVEGPEAFGEDAWVGGDVTLGTVGALVRKRTERCVIPSRAQPGLDQDRGLLRYLKANHAMCAGVYLNPHTPGELAVGDVIKTA
jgi:uncharacterized protein YcbX